MRSRYTPWVLVSFCAVVAALTLVACSKKEEASPASPAGTQAPQAATPAATPAQGAPMSATPVIASATFSEDPDLRCDLLEVKRVSGGAVRIRWRVVNTAGAQGQGLAATTPKSIHYDFGWEELYYIDPAENKKYEYLKDAEGNRILQVFWGQLPATQQRENWAKFPAPPATSTKISINIPKFPPFEDVSITP